MKAPVVTVKSISNGYREGFCMLEGHDFVAYIQKISVTIGRKTPHKPDIDVHLSDDRSVSRNHCEIAYNFKVGSFVLKIQSSNGVSVDGRKLFPKDGHVILHDGTELIIGTVRCFFRLPTRSSDQLGFATDREKAILRQLHAPSGRELIRPTVSFETMIIQALQDQPAGQSRLGGIYQWIESHYPFYRFADPSWKGVAMQTLMAHPCFERVTSSLNLERASPIMYKLAGSFRSTLPPDFHDYDATKVDVVSVLETAPSVNDTRRRRKPPTPSASAKKSAKPNATTTTSGGSSSGKRKREDGDDETAETGQAGDAAVKAESVDGENAPKSPKKRKTDSEVSVSKSTSNGSEVTSKHSKDIEKKSDDGEEENDDGEEENDDGEEENDDGEEENDDGEEDNDDGENEDDDAEEPQE